MELTRALPTVLALLNVCSFTLLVSGWVAIRRGRRDRHRALMLSNLGLAAVFLVAYVTQTVLVGHERFPGEGWLRSLFLAILGSHTLLAVSLLGLVPRTVYLALKGRFEQHRGIARVTLAVWIYVSVTGVVVYAMIHHLPIGR